MQVYFVTITESFIFNPLIFVSTQKDVAYIHTCITKHIHSPYLFPLLALVVLLYEHCKQVGCKKVMQ